MLYVRVVDMELIEFQSERNFLEVAFQKEFLNLGFTPALCIWLSVSRRATATGNFCFLLSREGALNPRGKEINEKNKNRVQMMHTLTMMCPLSLLIVTSGLLLRESPDSKPRARARSLRRASRSPSVF